MVVEVRPVAELVEEAVEALSSEALFALAARKAAAELRALDKAEPPTPVDWDACFKVDLNLTVRRLVELWRNLGIDADLASMYVFKVALSSGIDEARALEAIWSATGWRPRSAEERLQAAERAMLADGFSPSQIRRALAATEAAA